MDLGRTQEALGHMERGLEQSARGLVNRAEVVPPDRRGPAATGQKESARAACREGLGRYPDDTELLLEEAFILLDAKDFGKAKVNLLQLVDTTPAPYFGSADDGVRGYRTRHLLGGQYLSGTGRARPKCSGGRGAGAAGIPAGVVGTRGNSI